jgi:1-acyl-sn-glycerol-3-phosphate acyltransferase
MFTLFCFLRSALHMLWMGLTVVPFACAILLAAPFASKAFLYRIARTWLHHVVLSLRWICGVQWRITGIENIPLDGVAPVILAKHQSTYETFLLPAIMPRPIAYVYKKELNWVPFFGWAIAQLDMVHIDRKQGRAAFRKVTEEGGRIMASGVSVAMFPEGTRIPRGQVGEYKTGGTRLALATGGSVVPVAITSAKCWPRKGFIKYPGVVDVAIGAPIAARKGQSADALMAQVQDFIETHMQQLDPEAYPAV